MISVIVPAYDEEKRIAQTLKKLLKEKPGEIIVVFDGKDNTAEIARQFKKVKVLTFKKRLGKGKAVMQGFKAAKGDVIAFCDADYSKQKASVMGLAKKIDGYDIVIGIRNREKFGSFLRKIMSYGFNFLVRLILGLNISDTQCGMKVFRKAVLKDIFPKMKEYGWAFDVELLYLAKNKYKIREVNVNWVFDKDSKIKVFKDSTNMLVSLFRIRFRK